MVIAGDKKIHKYVYIGICGTGAFHTKKLRYCIDCFTAIAGKEFIKLLIDCQLEKES